jgi:phage repressor protein C with HTH and peptisase S24 domain
MQSLSTLAAKALEPGQMLRVTLRGNSMYPYFLDGDQLDVRKETYSRGDVVVFDLQGMLVAHRVIRIYGTSITAKGDASRLPETVEMAEIAGKVIAVFRGSKRLGMNSLRARLYCVFLPWSALALRAYRKYLI